MAAGRSETRAPPRRPRLLLICPDAVGPQMAGAGIRYWELARVLSAHAQVTLATGRLDETPASAVQLIAYEPHAPAALREAVAAADLVVAQPQWPVVAGWLHRGRARVVYDLYDPETFETLEMFAHRPGPLRRLMVALTLDRLDDALRGGDHFICASAKQRDLWLGAMLARRQIDTRRYDGDPSFRSVIDEVPFGLPDQPPAPGGEDPIGAAFPAIDGDDEVILWNGGIWNWLDAPGAVRAFALLSARRPRARMVFMGAAGIEAARRATDEARRAAADAGLLDRRVFFNDHWVPYHTRAGWLMRASCAVATHHEHLETQFAFRSRLLDCFWAGLPVVCTAGDELGELVAGRGCGETVPPEDAPALAAALERVLDRGRGGFAEALSAAAGEFAWSRVAAPLVSWVQEVAACEPAPPRPRAPARAGGHVLRSAAYRVSHRPLRAAFALVRTLRSEP